MISRFKYAFLSVILFSFFSHAGNEILCPTMIYIGENSSRITVGPDDRADYKTTVKSKLTSDRSICEYDTSNIIWPTSKDGFSSEFRVMPKVESGSIVNHSAFKRVEDAHLLPILVGGQVGEYFIAKITNKLFRKLFGKRNRKVYKCSPESSLANNIYADDDTYLTDADRRKDSKGKGQEDLYWKGSKYLEPNVVKIQGKNSDSCHWTLPKTVSVDFKRLTGWDNRELTTNVNRTGFYRAYQLTNFRCNSVIKRNCRSEGYTPRFEGSHFNVSSSERRERDEEAKEEWNLCFERWKKRFYWNDINYCP